MKTFKSIFGGRLANYVKLRRGLGLKFDQQVSVLRRFDRYVEEAGHVGPLTKELALEFAAGDPALSKVECSRRYHVVRHFSDYLSAFEPNTAILDPRLLPRPRTKHPAYIYTDEELVRLLQEARRISLTNPVRSITLHAMLGLVASTGLRISEVVRLDKTDMDLESGVLVVRQTKFDKDRLVPVHPTTREVLRNYAAVRDVTFPNCESPAAFINMSGRRFASVTLQLAFLKAVRRAGIRSAKGKGPRFHDLRHTFAVRRLVTWYKEGIDVQAMLPALATYLGHVNYQSTAYYLTATAELLGLAAERFERSAQQEEGPQP